MDVFSSLPLTKIILDNREVFFFESYFRLTNLIPENGITDGLGTRITDGKINTELLSSYRILNPPYTPVNPFFFAFSYH